MNYKNSFDISAHVCSSLLLSGQMAEAWVFIVKPFLQVFLLNALFFYKCVLDM